MTSRVNAELRELAAIARADAALASRLRSSDSRAILSETGAAIADPFWRAFHVFVAEHGHRETDFDAYLPTWREAPWVVLDHVRALLDAPPRGAHASDAGPSRDDAERALLERVPERMRDFVAGVVRLAREYTALDDLEHYHTTRLAPLMRRGVHALGDRLVEMGILTDPMDLFFARKDAVAAAVAVGDAATWRAVAGDIALAKRAYLDARERSPRWVLDDRGAEYTEEPASTGDALTGIPGSPGVAEGEVFVVTGVEDFPRFPRGAVLVARTTNPAWTPLFHSAAAIVTESGGPLSHGAVTAREMRIPAVMSVRGAMALTNGERVRVDGGRGVVKRGSGFGVQGSG